jgi:biotin operon repressor
VRFHPCIAAPDDYHPSETILGYACEREIGIERSYVMEEKVLEAIQNAGKPVRPGDIATALGMESKEVSKVIAKLKKQGKVTSPKRCYYAPAGE